MRQRTDMDSAVKRKKQQAEEEFQARQLEYHRTTKVHAAYEKEKRKEMTDRMVRGAPSKPRALSHRLGRGPSLYCASYIVRSLCIMHV